MPNKVIFSRIQNRRGPLENLPQPLRPGEIALTSDARRLWIGNEDVAPFGIRTLTPAVPVGPTSRIQQALTERMVSIIFNAPLSQSLFDQLTDFLSRENNRIFPAFVPPSRFVLVTQQTHVNYNGTLPNGSFVGGSGYGVNDVITLNNGSRITVTSVNAGVVDGFTIDYRGGEAIDGVAIQQQTVVPPGGIGFILTPSTNNITPAPAPDKATFYNAVEQVLWDGNRSVFIGLRVSELEFAAEKDANWDTDPDLAMISIMDAYPGGFPVAVSEVNLADDEFAKQQDGITADWQGPSTSAKVRNFSNPLLTSIASGNVAKLINLIAASSLVLDTTQNHTDFNGSGGNGSFTGGTNYLAGDIITLSNGSNIIVNSVDGGGAVLTFSVDTRGSQIVINFALQQSSVVDQIGDPAPGINFSLTPSDNNVVLVVSDETVDLVTTVSNIEIGVVDIFDETEFPSDLVFESFDYEVVLTNTAAVNFPTGIAFPATTSDSVFVEYTLRNDTYAATGNMRLSLFGSQVSVNDQRNSSSTLTGDITLSADYVFGGQQIRVLYTNTLSPATDDLVLKMIVRRWVSSADIT